ncbi:hypothetical protein [Streptomyces sp. WZ-12]|uniref:hypothetical protein n=1 Tax=Streptomyces sp. WZ-12 TaxID=3030210 RepID=UPI0023810A81|nr:hypothetical protein [Streptomyces sp. WZ-12]
MGTPPQPPPIPPSFPPRGFPPGTPAPTPPQQPGRGRVTPLIVVGVAVLSALTVAGVALAIWAPWSEGRTPAAARPAPTAQAGNSTRTVVVLVTQTATPEQTDALRAGLQATRGVLSVQFISPQQWASCAHYLPPASQSQQPSACLVTRVSNDVSTAALSRAVSRMPGVRQVTD